MEKLKYTIIKDEAQHKKYCAILENLLQDKNENSQDEIELLSLLIEKWENDRYIYTNPDPVTLIKELMTAHNLKANDLANILGLTKGTISKVLNYKKGLSKETIRKLAMHFKVSQEMFNRPYKIFPETNKKSDIEYTH